MKRFCTRTDAKFLAGSDHSTRTVSRQLSLITLSRTVTYEPSLINVSSPCFTMSSSSASQFLTVRQVILVDGDALAEAQVTHLSLTSNCYLVVCLNVPPSAVTKPCVATQQVYLRITVSDMIRLPKPSCDLENGPESIQSTPSSNPTRTSKPVSMRPARRNNCITNLHVSHVFGRPPCDSSSRKHVQCSQS